MTGLVIGGRGLIGSALCAELETRALEFVATSRRDKDALGTMFRFRLGVDDPSELPDADVVYLVAGMPGFAACESDRMTWIVNVDAPIAIARRFHEAAVIFVSSEAVEIACHTAYARQKAQVESYMLARSNAWIARPGRVTVETAPAFARFLVSLPGKRSGLHRWMA